MIIIDWHRGGYLLIMTTTLMMPIMLIFFEDNMASKYLFMKVCL